MPVELEGLLAERLRGLGPSVIRELTRLGKNPGMISFAGGHPSAETFPAAGIREAADRAMEGNWVAALQYGVTQGLPELVEVLAAMGRDMGHAVSGEHILVTSGGAQALDLICKVLLDPGDEVIVESPSYPGAIHTLRTYQAVLIPVPLEDDGISVDALENLLCGRARRGRRPKFLYTIPTFQNPSGITASPARRRLLVELARRHGMYIVEDDPYLFLRFRGEAVPTIRSLDGHDGCVIRIDSFSKIFAPGARLGWITAPPALIGKLAIAKQAVDLHTSSLIQAIALEFCRLGYLERQLQEIPVVYRRKLDAMLAAIAGAFPGGVEWTRPEGGFFLWVTLPGGCDAGALLQKAIAAGVLFVPGAAFSVDGRGVNCLRLSYATPDEDAIRTGIGILGQLLAEAIQNCTKEGK